MSRQEGIKWMTRLSVMLLAFLCFFVFLKLSPIWKPILSIIKAAFIPFFIAVFITYLLHPLVEKLYAKGFPRTLAILLIYILFFGGIGLGLYKGIPNMIAQMRELMTNIPDITKTYEQWLMEVDHHTSKLPHTIHVRIEEYIQSIEKYVEKMASTAVDSIRKIVDYFFVFIIIPFLVFYFLKDIEKIKRTIWYITPRKWRKEGKRLLHDIDESLGGYIRGQILVGLILGGAATLALWAIHMPYPILLGALIAVTDIIPYFGPILGAIPVIFIALTISVKMVIVVIVIMLVLQFIEGNLLGPFIIGRSLQIHPVLIIFALLVGGEIGGIPGLILGVPVFAVLKVIFMHIRNYRLSLKFDKES
nr:AI-2E family transporter [Fictibacillus gelatini]